jgi:hypothetical protein
MADRSAANKRDQLAFSAFQRRNALAPGIALVLRNPETQLLAMVKHFPAAIQATEFGPLPVRALGFDSDKIAH